MLTKGGFRMLTSIFCICSDYKITPYYWDQKCLRLRRLTVLGRFNFVLSCLVIILYRLVQFFRLIFKVRNMHISERSLNEIAPSYGYLIVLIF